MSTCKDFECPKLSDFLVYNLQNPAAENTTRVIFQATCRVYHCVDTPDLTNYNLQTNVSFNANPLTVVVDCPEGYTCGSTEITFPPGTIVLPPPIDGVITIQGCLSLITGTDVNQVMAEYASQLAVCMSVVDPGVPNDPNNPPPFIPPPTNPPPVNPVFRNHQVIFTKVCTPPSVLQYSGTLPVWITLVGNTLVGAANTFVGATQAAADAAAQANLNAFGNGAIAGGSLACSSDFCQYINTNTLPDGNVGAAYSHTLVYTGPVSGVGVWSLNSGSLPDGLSLDSSTGVVSGTPTTEALYGFSISFTNGLGTCAIPFTVDIGASLFCSFISGNNPPSGVVDNFYSYTLVYTGPITFTEVWTLASGSLPTGLGLGSVFGNPTILGLPNTPGHYSFSLNLTSDLGTCTIPLSIDIAPTGCGLNSNTPPSGNVNTAYTYTFTFTGTPSGVATWSLNSGTLPPGLSLNASTGVLSGTPTTSDIYVFSIKYHDDGGDCVSTNFSVPIFPEIICPDLADLEWLGFIQNGGTFTPATGSHNLTFSANATASAFTADYFVQSFAAVPYVLNQFGCRMRIVGTVEFTGTVPANDNDQFCQYVLFDSGNSQITAAGSFYGRFGNQSVDVSFDLPTTAPVGQYKLLISLAANSVAVEVRSSQFDGTISLV